MLVGARSLIHLLARSFVRSLACLLVAYLHTAPKLLLVVAAAAAASTSTSID